MVWSPLFKRRLGGVFGSGIAPVYPREEFYSALAPLGEDARALTHADRVRQQFGG